ncbi:hypothetical protein ACO2Q1_02420 [Brevundimonas sp. VNH65]|uniref:hypothetical protein n=1 Tax=Brevundimonas sp. VNH65 TaxID=3400917 RepID=UPI003BFAF217
MVSLTATYDSPPEILVVDDEIILRTPRGDTVYSRWAAQELAAALNAALARLPSPDNE